MRNPMIRPRPIDIPALAPVGPASLPPPLLMIGLDLGQLVDPSAASVIRSSVVEDPDRPGQPLKSPRTGRPIRRHDVVALKRYDLGTSYPNIVRHIDEQLRRPPLAGALLVMDATSVGRPIVDLFRELWVTLAAITLTGGKGWSNPQPLEFNVSKFEIVAAARVAMETQSLLVAPGVPQAELLRRELMSFRVKKSKSQNDIYSEREGEYDDLVISVALPLWYANMLDQSRPFITGADRVPLDPPRNPLRISAGLSGIVGEPRGLPYTPRR